MSYHSGLIYLFDQLNLNAMQARWLNTLSEFDIEIRYIMGKENQVAEALSRKVHVNHITTMSFDGRKLQKRILQVR